MKKIMRLIIILIPAVYTIWIYVAGKIEGAENLHYVWVLALLILLSNLVTYTKVFLEYKPMQLVMCIGVLFLVIATTTGYYSFDLDYPEERALLQFISKVFTLSTILMLSIGPAVINTYKRYTDRKRGIK